MKKILVLLAMFTMMTPAFAAEKYASVDLDKVLRSYTTTARINADLQREESAIRVFVLDAQKKVVSAKTDAEKKSLEERFNKELQTKVDTLQKKKVDALRAIEADVKAAINKVGQSGSYTLILTSNNTLYGTVDISDQIIKILNTK